MKRFQRGEPRSLHGPLHPRPVHFVNRHASSVKRQASSVKRQVSPYTVHGFHSTLAVFTGPPSRSPEHRERRARRPTPVVGLGADGGGPRRGRYAIERGGLPTALRLARSPPDSRSRHWLKKNDWSILCAAGQTFMERKHTQTRAAPAATRQSRDASRCVVRATRHDDPSSWSTRRRTG